MLHAHCSAAASPNPWKAEQKHDAERKKLEELRKQIQEERERSEFRLLQEQAGLIPRQGRLDFLYDSRLVVGKGSSDGFKALEAFHKTDPQTASSSSANQQQLSVPRALFVEKAQSANDAWRKLHSDPLLLMRERERERAISLSLCKEQPNPDGQDLQIRFSTRSFGLRNLRHLFSTAEVKAKEKTFESKNFREKRHHKKSKHQNCSSSECHSDSEDVADDGEDRKILVRAQKVMSIQTSYLQVQ